MINKKLLAILFVIVFNLWIYRILSIDIFIGLLTLVATIFLYYKKFNLTLILFILLLFFQYKESSINSLTFLNESEETLKIQRMHGYPPRFYRFANWLEARPEATLFYKLQENLSEVVNPNLFFFANHPRERAGITEYEKFPYILLPFFIIGIFSRKSKDDLKFLFISMSPLLLISVIGSSNPLGHFSLFPLFASNIATGLIPLFEKKSYFWVFLILFSLVFVQTLVYATY